MNTKAFTLIELIAVVSILAVIFIVSFPNFVLISKKDNEEQYEIMKKNLCLAGETYIYNNINEVLEDGTNVSIEPNYVMSIKIQYLIDAGLVDKNLKDIKSNESLENKVLLFTVLSDKTLKCEYNKEE